MTVCVSLLDSPETTCQAARSAPPESVVSQPSPSETVHQVSKLADSDCVFFFFFASISSLFNYCGHLKVISSTCALHPYQFLRWGKLVSTRQPDLIPVPRTRAAETQPITAPVPVPRVGMAGIWPVTAPMPVPKRRVASLLRQPHPPVEPAEHPAQALQEQPESALCPLHPKWLRLC